jgi:oligopeptide transport system substrate-binding protein
MCKIEKHQGGETMIKKSVLSFFITVFLVTTVWNSVSMGQSLSSSKLEATSLAVQFNVNGEITSGESGFYHNGKEYVPLGLLHNDTLYVQVSFTLEALDKKMEWDSQTHTIYISNKNSDPPAELSGGEAPDVQQQPAPEQDDGEALDVQQIPVHFNVHGANRSSQSSNEYELEGKLVPLALEYKDTMYAPAPFIANILEKDLYWEKEAGLITFTDIYSAKGKDKRQNVNLLLDFYLHYNLRQMNLDAQQVAGKDVQLILNHVMEGLMLLDQDGKAIPGVAEEVQVSEDGRVYTFKLRETKWSDGSEVRAEDFRYGWLRAVELGSPLSFLFDNIEGIKAYRNDGTGVQNVGIRAVGDHTLKVTLNHPDPGFLTLLVNPAFFPVNKSFVEEKGERYGYTESNLLYNGPFVLQYVSNNSLYFKKNEAYWNKDSVHLEQLSFVYKNPAPDSVIPNHHSYDMVVPSGLEEIESLGATQKLITVQEDNMYFALLNHQSTLFSNKKLRQAVAHLLKQKDIAQEPHKAPANGLIGKGLSGLKGLYHLEYGIPLLDNDVAKAKQLIAEAKKELGVPQLPVVQFVIGETTKDEEHVSKIIALLEEGGLDVELVLVDSYEWFQKYEEGNYDLGLMGWDFDYDNPLNLLEIFESSNAQNYAQYSNSDYDRNLDSAKREQNLEKRFQLIQSTERQLIEDVVVVPLFSFEYDYVKQDYVKGVYYHTYGSPLDFSHAYIMGRQTK